MTCVTCDGLNSLRVEASAESPLTTLKRHLPEVEWAVTAVTTADVADGGFDGDVYIKLYGSMVGDPCKHACKPAGGVS